MKPVSVVIVDDSPTVRAVLRRLLAAGDIHVIGEAGDGREGVDLTVQLGPDVVVMDLELPTMNGVEASVQISRKRPTPIVVVTSRGDGKDVSAVFESAKTGAVGIFAKPEDPEAWNQLGADLRETILELGMRRNRFEEHHLSESLGHRVERRPAVIAVGASTGGPAALHTMLAALGPGLEAGIAVVQHISEGFEEGLARWLATDLGLDVDTARDGQLLAPGTVRIAPAGAHLRVEANLVQRLDLSTPPIRGHRPSADALFESLLQHDPNRVAAVVLSGMGSDGAEGMAALQRAGAITLVQDEPSCAVYGMPRAALALGAAELALNPGDIGRFLGRSAKGGG